MKTFNHSYALVIGIDAYGHGIAPLNNAVNDANAIADLLEIKHGYKVFRLLDEEASLEAIERWLKSELPQQIQSGDRLLFYFSGHGIQLSDSEGPQGYLIPQTARLGQSQSYLSMHEVVRDLSALPCRHFLAILDCCFAGSFRWASQHRKATVIDETPLYREKYDRYIRDRAWQAITSAAYDQLAYDAFDLRNDRGQDTTAPQHSPFATALLAGLSGNADMSPPATKPGQRPGDGVTTATELYQYLRDAVEPPTETRGMRQTPELCALGKHDKGEYVFLTPGHPLNLPDAPALDRTTNPYKGLASFDENDRDRYFGRKTIAIALHQFFLKHQLTIVLGPSGSGKSSLVKAGLLPLLRESPANDTPWVILKPFRPGRSPFQSLNQVLTELDLPTVSPDAAKTGHSREQPSEHNEPEQITKDESSLTPNLTPEAGLKNWFDQSPVSLLVVIDQFEELVTRCRDQERQQFLETMVSALTTYPDRLRVIITLRSDFESQFQSSPLAPFWQASRFQVSALSRKELRQAIEEPAALRVLFFDPPEMVERLIDEVVNMPGGLPLLSFALSELYLSYLRRQESASKEGGAIERAIAQEDYEALGGVTTALIQRAETEYQALVQEDTAYAQTIQQVMLRMVALGTGDLARRPLLVSEQKFLEPEHSRVQTVLSHFLEARLLVAGKTTDGESFVEPAHDALVRGWPRLNQWLKQKEVQETVLLIRSLTSVANRWVSGQQIKESKGLLWKEDPRLPQALQVMCGTPYQTGQMSFFHWLAQNTMATLKLQSQNFWDSLSRSVWLNAREETFIKNSLERKYRSRLTRDGLVVLIMIGLGVFAAATVVRGNRADRATQISEIREKSARALNWLSTERNLEGLALSINTLQDSLQYSDEVQAGVLSSLVSAVQTAREQNRLYGHEDGVRAVAYSSDTTYVASCGSDGTIKLWNAKTGERVWDRKASDQRIHALAFSPNSSQLVSTGQDGILRIWDVKTRQQIGKNLVGHDKAVNSVAFSSDGLKIASGSDDKTLRIWDIEDPQQVETIQNKGEIYAIAFHPTQPNQVASGDIGGAVRLWDIETEKQIGQPMKEHQGAVRSVAFNTDGSTLASGSSDRTLRLWDPNKQKAIGESLRGHGDRVYSVKFSPDDRYIVSAGADRSIRLWDAANGEASGQILNAHNSHIRAIDISHDNDQIVSSGIDSIIRLWDIRSQEPTGQPLFSDHKRSILSIERSPDTDQYLVSADEQGKIKLWEYHTNRQISFDLGTLSAPSYSVTISSQQVVGTGNDGTLKIWDIATKKEVHTLKGHGGKPIYSAAFSPDGKVLVTGGRDGTLHLWDPVRGEQLGPALSDHKSAVYSVSFSPDGRHIISGSRDDKLILWDVITREPIRTFEGHKSDVWSVAFSHDSQKIASGGSDNTILIWEMHTDEPIKQLSGHSNTVRSVQFSPHNSNLLASSGDDSTVRLWNIERGQQMGPALTGHVDSVWSVLFNSGGTRMMSAGADLSLRVWPTRWHKWPEMACERIQYHPILTEPERIFEDDQDSIDLANQTKLACEQEFWQDMQAMSEP